MSIKCSHCIYTEKEEGRVRAEGKTEAEILLKYKVKKKIYFHMLLINNPEKLNKKKSY